MMEECYDPQCLMLISDPDQSFFRAVAKAETRLEFLKQTVLF